MGRQLLLKLGPLPVEVPLAMDRAYESDENKQLLVLELNMIPVIPPNRTGANRGTMIANSTRSGTKRSACFDG